jgi:hypothetical protein
MDTPWFTKLVLIILVCYWLSPIYGIFALLVAQQVSYFLLKVFLGLEVMGYQESNFVNAQDPSMMNMSTLIVFNKFDAEKVKQEIS